MKKQNNTQNISKMRKLLRKTPHSKPFDQGFRRMHYTRYADDFLIGITGPKENAEKIKRIIKKYLNLKLKIDLNEEKTLITKANKRIKFLGYCITQAERKTVKRRLKKQGMTIKTSSSRSRLKFLVDTKKVINKLSTKNYCNKQGEPIPNF